MKKFFIKSILFSFIFSIFVIGAYFIAKAWSGTGNLTSNPGDKLTSAIWNNLVARTTPIVCYKNGSSGSTTQGAWHYTFVAADCGGTLPDASYVGSAGYVSIGGSSFTMFQVMNSGETGEAGVGAGPGVFARTATAPNGTYILRVIYIKK